MIDFPKKLIDPKFYKELFEERIAIAMFDGGQTEQEARNIAFKDVSLKWIEYNPPKSYNGYSCVHCDAYVSSKTDCYMWAGLKFCNQKHRNFYIDSQKFKAKETLNLIGISND
jgi:hypothetical protein